MTLGNRDLSNLVLPTGWDAAQLDALAIQDGTTYATVAGMLNTAVGGLNSMLFNDPIYNQILYFTNDPIVQYNVGGADSAERHTEYGRPDAQRADLEGHMLPLDAWDRGLGWTWDYLRKANMTQIQADIAMSVAAFRNRWQLEILGRLFRRADVTGAAVGLGAGGISPGFATAAASTGVDFNPPAWGGTTFSTAHEHYVAIAGGVPTAAMYADIEAELREHGHFAPFDVWISPLDEAATRLITGFYPIGSPMVNYGVNTAFANLTDGVDELNGSYYIGVIGNTRIRVVPRIPQYYAFGFKSYGNRSPRNPLAVRLGKGVTSPNVIAMTDPRAGNATTPLQYMMLFLEFGVGVGADRTVATPRYTNNATWADAVIV